MRYLSLGLIVVGGLLMGHVRAASFDCGKAATAIEKLICGTNELSVLDSELQKNYEKALSSLDGSDKESLIKEQRNWIKYVRNICAEGACLERVYRSRIALLAKTKDGIADEGVCSIPQGGSCRSVVYYRDSSKRISSFNDALVTRKLGARVIGCDRLIDLPVGYARSNHSFGGYCTIVEGRVRSRVMICNDNMLGHFAMRSIRDDEEIDDNLIKFTDENCFGG